MMLLKAVGVALFLTGLWFALDHTIGAWAGFSPFHYGDVFFAALGGSWITMDKSAR